MNTTPRVSGLHDVAAYRERTVGSVFRINIEVIYFEARDAIEGAVGGVQPDAVAGIQSDELLLRSPSKTALGLFVN